MPSASMQALALVHGPSDVNAYDFFVQVFIFGIQAKTLIPRPRCLCFSYAPPVSLDL